MNGEKLEGENQRERSGATGCYRDLHGYIENDLYHVLIACKIGAFPPEDGEEPDFHLHDLGPEEQEIVARFLDHVCEQIDETAQNMLEALHEIMEANLEDFPPEE